MIRKRTICGPWQKALAAAAAVALFAGHPFAALHGAVIAVQVPDRGIVIQGVGNVAPTSYDLDFNNDGAPEIRYSFASTGGGLTRGLSGTAVLGAAYENYPDQLGAEVYRLDAGAVIGIDSPGSHPEYGSRSGWWDFSSPNSVSGFLYVTLDTGSSGQFVRKRGYMGVQFLIDGETHYGWVELENPFGQPWETRIYGWGYETEPNKPILAGAVPEPGTASIALAGLAGLGRRRRCRRVYADTGA